MGILQCMEAKLITLVIRAIAWLERRQSEHVVKVATMGQEESGMDKNQNANVRDTVLIFSSILSF